MLRTDATRFINVFSTVVLTSAATGATSVELSVDVPNEPGAGFDAFSPAPAALPPGFRLLSSHAADMIAARDVHDACCPHTHGDNTAPILPPSIIHSRAASEASVHSIDVAPQTTPATPAAQAAKAPCGCKWAVLRVVDNAPGRDALAMDNMFKPFEHLRLGDLHDGMAAGSALSFVILRRVVADLGGVLWMASQPGGQGNVICSILPLRERSALSAPPSSTAASEPLEDEKARHVENMHMVSLSPPRDPEPRSITPPEASTTPPSTESRSRTLQTRIQPSTDSVFSRREAPVASRQSMSEPVALIVDDVRSVRLLLRRSVLALLGERAKVHEAADGREAVAKALELWPAVIFMDRRMPVMEGDAATRELRRRGYTGAIYGITGDALPVDVSAFRDAGATDVLIKPVTRAVLSKALRDCGALPQPAEFEEGLDDSGSRGAERDLPVLS